MEVILAIGAHNDDQIIGCGGTLAKYAREGKIVKTIVCSFGESSHPHYKKEVIAKTRVLEAQKSDNILGGEGITFLAMKEGKFKEEFEKKGNQILKMIKELKPTKIFTHSADDPHPDHRVVHNFIKKNKDKINADIYSFDIWNLFSIKKSDTPKLVVDISKTYAQKIKAFEVHKSQQIVVSQFKWKIYIKDRINGLMNKCKYAEVFHRI